MLIIKGVNVFPSQIESALVGMEGVGPHYQLVVRRRNFLDNLEVKVELLNADLLESYGALETLQRKIHDRLKSVLGLDTRVTLAEPKSLERFQGKAKRCLLYTSILPINSRCFSLCETDKKPPKRLAIRGKMR